MRGPAEQGNPDAQYQLGVSYDLGKGVAVDWILAHKWLNLSASRTRGAKSAISGPGCAMLSRPSWVLHRSHSPKAWRSRGDRSPNARLPHALGDHRASCRHGSALGGAAT